MAICDIDKSTKKAREKRFIGAKGIGFKSVAWQHFKASPSVKASHRLKLNTGKSTRLRKARKCVAEACDSGLCVIFEVFLVTATPVIHSGRFHFHFDADALFLGFYIQVSCSCHHKARIHGDTKTCRTRNGLGSLLPFPLTPVTPVSRQTGTQLVLPLSSSEGEGFMFADKSYMLHYASQRVSVPDS